MAETETGQERTEQPTSKRLEEARRQGQVPRSVDLSTAAVVLIAGAGLRLLGAHMTTQLHGLMRADLALSRQQIFDEGTLVPTLASSIAQALLISAPILALTLAAALLVPLTLGGWNLSFEALIPDFSRLSPLAGFKRMFSGRGAMDLGKAFAKFAVVATIATMFLRAKAPQLLQLGAEPVNVGLAHSAVLAGQAFLEIAASLALIAAIDVPWQLWQYTQRLRMSRQEIRQEHKESDGSPETKSRIRKAQQEVAKRRMMQEVPKADVVVVNPTHFAVALKYDENRMRAPVVVAKGADEVAARIRMIAQEHRVPIFEAPPLARALFRSVALGDEIPATLYLSVAQVLTYVYQLGTALRSGDAPPAPPTIDSQLDETRH